MNSSFYSLETLIIMHLLGRPIFGTREYCDGNFLDALANEENQ
jgi:hypothetical protein